MVDPDGEGNGCWTRAALLLLVLLNAQICIKTASIRPRVLLSFQQIFHALHCFQVLYVLLFRLQSHPILVSHSTLVPQNYEVEHTASARRRRRCESS